MVPVSVRSGDESETYQNRVSALLADLATNESDPAKRLRRVQQSMTAAKQNLAAIPAETLMDYTQFAPPAIAARAMRMASRLRIADRMNPPFNLVISNVPGPNVPLYMAGAELKHFYPVSALADGQGPQHDGAELQRQPRLRLHRLPRARPRCVDAHRVATGIDEGAARPPSSQPIPMMASVQ